MNIVKILFFSMFLFSSCSRLFDYVARNVSNKAQRIADKCQIKNGNSFMSVAMSNGGNVWTHKNNLIYGYFVRFRKPTISYVWEYPIDSLLFFNSWEQLFKETEDCVEIDGSVIQMATGYDLDLNEDKLTFIFGPCLEHFKVTEKSNSAFQCLVFLVEEKFLFFDITDK